MTTALLIDGAGELTSEGEASLAAHLLGAKSLERLQAESPVTEEDHWLIPGLVSTSNTFLYGQSKVGKSFLASQLVASLVEGTPLLGRRPLSHGHKVLVVAIDSGGRMEYQERIANLGVTGDKVSLVQIDRSMGQETWENLYTLVAGEGFNVVVLDHATAGIEGEFNSVEGWNQLWNRLKGFGPGVARILIGHATDSKFEGSTIHRPSGSYAATANARSRVYVWAPGGLDNALRKIELVSNNAPSETLHALQDSDGYLFTDPDGQDAPNPERTTTRKGTTNEIIRLALAASPMSQTDLLAQIAESPSVRTSNGDQMSPGTIRNRLNDAESIEWDRKGRKYRRKTG